MSIIQKVGRGVVFVSVATLLARLGSFAGDIAIIRLLGMESVGRLGLLLFVRGAWDWALCGLL